MMVSDVEDDDDNLRTSSLVSKPSRMQQHSQKKKNSTQDSQKGKGQTGAADTRGQVTLPLLFHFLVFLSSASSLPNSLALCCL